MIAIALIPLLIAVWVTASLFAGIGLGRMMARADAEGSRGVAAPSTPFRPSHG